MKPLSIVTGGAAGIGLAVAERLLDEGWSVAVIDADQHALTNAEDLLGGEEAIFLAADVTDEDEIADAFDQAVDAFGPVSALINCASLRQEMPFETTSAELFRQILEINLVGPFVATQAALMRMDDVLSIVMLGTVSALRANAGYSAYGASKAGMKLMTEAMALELASRGVRVNCVAHGWLDGSPSIFDSETGLRRAWLAHTPQRRSVEMSEITAAVSFLLSNEARAVTGHTLVVDGGFSVAGLPRRD